MRKNTQNQRLVRSPRYSSQALTRYAEIINQQSQQLQSQQQNVQQWRRVAMTPALIMNDQRLILALYRANKNNPYRVFMALRQLAGMAQLQLQQVAASPPAIALTAPQKPLSPEQLQQLGFPVDPTLSLGLTQKLDAELGAQEQTAEAAEAMQLQYQQEISAELDEAAMLQAALDHYDQEFTPNQDHPVHDEIKKEVAIEGLIKLAQRPEPSASLSKEIEQLLMESKVADLARSAIPRAAPGA